jgi:uncharacterized protein
MFKKIGEKQFKRLALLSVTLIVGLTMVFGYYMTTLRLDYDFEKFFPKSDPDSDFFFDHREKFQSDNDFLLLAVENKGNIFEASFLKKVNKLSAEISALPKVTFTRDITKEKEFFIYPTGRIEKPYITEGYSNLKEDAQRIYANKENINVLVSKDKKSLCIFIKHEDFLAKKNSVKLLKSIDDLTKKYKFDNSRLAGRVIGQEYYIKKMTTEMSFFISLSMILVVIFLIVAFRSAWGVLLPQVVIILSMIWILGFMGMMRESVNILLTILPSIMFIVSMSDVIHLMSKYLDLLRADYTKFDAIKQTIKEIGLATFLTSFTTSIGFLSLIFMSVQPIQVFGLYTGIGVMIAFVLTFIALPVLLYYFPPPKMIEKSKQSTFWTKYLQVAFRFILSKPKQILWGSVITTVVFGFASIFLNANNFMMDDLKPTEPIKEDFAFLDKHYGGIRPFELAVTLKNAGDSFWDAEKLNELDRVEKYIEANYQVQVNFSLPSAIKLLNRASNSGVSEFYSIPESKSKIRKYKSMLKLAEDGKVLAMMLDSSQTVTRMSGMMPDLGNDAVTILREKFEKFITKDIKSTTMNYKVTGTPELLDKNMKYLSSNLILGLSLSIAIIALVMGFIFRSFKMMIISIIPNIIPMVVTAGAMAIFGIELKITTAIIFTISFGIAVDDTIHLLGKFKYELGQGKSKLYALKRAYLSTGKAMVITTLILVSGFLILMFSSFMGTFYMGFMVSLALIVALIFDMLLLPVLLLFFYTDKKQKSQI